MRPFQASCVASRTPNSIVRSPQWRNDRRSRANDSSSVTIMPPSPVWIGLTHPNENIPTSPRTRRPPLHYGTEPKAGIFDQFEAPRLRQRAERGHVSGFPHMWVAIRAFVCGPIRPSTSERSSMNVRSQMSAKTGVTPAFMTAIAVAEQVSTW